MSAPESDEEEIEVQFRDLCLAVNLDKQTMELAWQSYESAKTNYTLEGDELHWLVCALYSACRRNLPLMRSVSGQQLSSNCVSLTMLLREAKFSFISFLKKMEKWLDMKNNSIGPLADHVASLDRSFRVSTVIFKKYRDVFNYVFLNPDDPNHQSALKNSSKNPSRPHRSRRYLRRQCTPKEVFSFCWTLFIYAKGTEFRSVSDELLSSFQLLLGAVDLCFKNALACEHKTALLNPDFPGLHKGWEENNLQSCEHDIIALLVKHHTELSKEETDDFLLQARVRNTHNWKSFLIVLLNPDNNIFSGTETTLLTTENFDTNSKAINKIYEEYVLTEGDFDERVFLCDEADEELGTPIKGQLSEIKRDLRKDVTQQYTMNSTPKTPLTNRQYLEGKRDNEDVTCTPVSTSLLALSKLRKILQGKKPEASSRLQAIFSDCETNPEETIKTRVNKLGNVFKKSYTKEYDQIPPSTLDVAESRFLLSTTLYYHVLEGTLLQEKKRLKNPNVDLSGLLKRDDFHKLLFACCVEIVLCSYDSPRVFPWVLQAFDLAPYYFYKVFELVVRAEDNLSGNCIKHLNRIEEQILESLAWSSDSPLWDALPDDYKIPSCAEVNHSQHIECNGEPSHSGMPPLPHPRLKAVADSDIVGRKSDLGSVQDRFSSPSPGTAKRRLFNSHGENTTKVSATKPDESKSGDAANQVDEKRKPKKVGSLALFCRKVYHLASVRLRHLSESLAISVELRSKIWTCFEHSISECGYDLMRDRHIDQLLMCSVYVMAKVTQHEQSFQEIMRCYRNQPQATSAVYRSVLIERSVSPEPIPSRPTLRSSGTIRIATPSPPARTPEVRDDLILFYNKVYVPKMKSFVTKFNPSSNHSLEVPLSPMPRPRTTLQSPRRVSANIYVSPMKSRALLVSTSSPMEYNFQRSPAGHLRSINRMVSRYAPSISTKRHLAFNDADVGDAKRPAPALPRQLELMQAIRNDKQS